MEETMPDNPFPVPEERIAATLHALKSNEYLAYFVPEAREAKQMVLEAVGEGARVGLAGSKTLRQMDLPAALLAKGATLLDHWDPSLSVEESLQVRREQLLCDLFLSSVNAVTETGELVSCDGIGNRIAAATFGPWKVMLLVGAQKIVPDRNAALQRIKTVAPQRAQGLELDLPCTDDGVCVDCSDPNRICRATLVLHRRPMLTDMTVILIGEPLGI
jgi:hypothetical protein